MDVKTLREKLDDFGGHVPAIVEIDGQAYEIDDVDSTTFQDDGGQQIAAGVMTGKRL
jgi:hypothetical protein